MTSPTAAPPPPLSVTHPKLVDDWDPARNHGPPGGVTPGSQRVVWWRCAAGHSWRARVASRAAGRGCPACAGKVTTPSTSLRHRAPRVAAQWHPTLNEPLTPEEVTSGSNRRVWWLCACGHEWATTVHARTHQGADCPGCSGRVATPGRSLASLLPHLAEEWAGELNAVGTDAVRPGSGYVAWWRCPADGRHVWRAAVYARSGGQGCPFCAGRQVLPERSVAADAHLMTEWDQEANGALDPAQVGLGSHRRVWWRCGRGHAWQAEVVSRSRLGAGCGRCVAVRRSRLEREVADGLAAVLPVEADASRVRGASRWWAVDIVMPAARLVVEVDGAYWHRGREAVDGHKAADLVEVGWVVVRARQRPLRPLHPNDVAIDGGCGACWATVIVAHLRAQGLAEPAGAAPPCERHSPSGHPTRRRP